MLFCRCNSCSCSRDKGSSDFRSGTSLIRTRWKRRSRVSSSRPFSHESPKCARSSSGKTARLSIKGASLTVAVFFFLFYTPFTIPLKISDTRAYTFAAPSSKTTTSCWLWRLSIAMWSSWINISEAWVSCWRDFSSNQEFVCLLTGVWAWHHLQLWESLLHPWWVAGWRRDSGDVQEECAKSDRSSGKMRITSRKQISDKFLFLSTNFPHPGCTSRGK